MCYNWDINIYELNQCNFGRIFIFKFCVYRYQYKSYLRRSSQNTDTEGGREVILKASLQMYRLIHEAMFSRGRGSKGLPSGRLLRWSNHESSAGSGSGIFKLFYTFNIALSFTFLYNFYYIF